jgi:predicted nucleic acid-binding protein
VRYLLDTNVVSELIAREPNPRVVRWVDDLDPHGVYLSVVTVGELQKGIEKLPDSRRKTDLRGWLEGDLLVRFDGRMLVLDVGAMLAWGAMMGRLALARHELDHRRARAAPRLHPGDAQRSRLRRDGREGREPMETGRLAWKEVGPEPCC